MSSGAFSTMAPPPVPIYEPVKSAADNCIGKHRTTAALVFTLSAMRSEVIAAPSPRMAK